MQDLGFDFQQPDMKIIGRFASAANRTSDASFFNFDQDSETSFYLLPPWKQERQCVLLAREVWEAFLPEKKKWTSHRTWSYIDPDFGATDPIEEFLDELSEQVPGIDLQEIRRHTPKPRFYVNALIAGTKKLPHGDFQNNTKIAEPQILNLPASVWNEICVLMSRPGFEAPFDPTSAILFVVQKTGRGLSTEYKVEFAGTRGATGDVVPNRYNLVEHLGVDVLKRIIGEDMANLDSRWSPPDLNNTNYIQRREEGKRALKTKFLKTSTAIPGAAQAPFGSAQIGGNAPPPMAPAAPAAAPAAPAAAPAAPLAAPAAPTGVPAPSAAPPVAPVATQAAPPVAAPLPTPAAPVSPSEAPAASPVAEAPSPVPAELQAPDLPTPNVPGFPGVNFQKG